MTKIDYIFIDLDGPILEGKFRHYQCYTDILKKYGGIPVDIDEYWQLKRNMIKRTVLLEKSAFKGTYDDFMNMWLANIEAPEYLKLDYLKPDVQETLRNFKVYCSNLFLVTMRNKEENLYKQLENLQIKDLFDRIIVCHSTSDNPKYAALKDVSFNTAVFIGDTEEDTKTAKKLGIPSIGITNGLRDKSKLDADYYAEEIRDIELNAIIEK